MKEMVSKQKLLEKAYFIVNDWSCYVADQFCLLESALRFSLDACKFLAATTNVKFLL